MDPLPEWVAATESLSDAQLAAGLESIAKSGKSYLPTLPEFLAACRNAREFARPVSRALTDDRFDAWAIAGNSHLSAYLRSRQTPQRYHPDARYVNGSVLPGPEGTLRTLCLVRAKNRWAQTMRESVEEGGVDPETQRAFWKVEMMRAEEEIDALIAGTEAA